MGQESTKTVLVATIIIVGVSAAGLLFLINSGNLADTGNTSGIVSMRILANSSDLLYPELAEANFVFLRSDTWQVSANFVNDSIGWYEDLEVYDRDFMVTSEEVKSIDDALHEGLNGTTPSNTSAIDLMEIPPPNIWFEIDITYTDGTWIFVTAFQTEAGTIIANNGTGTLDTNLLYGTVLEPLSAFDHLVLAVYTVFLNHLS